ncbi:MAG: cytidylate kinase-like family protein, partial [Planctomycetota bacterium]
VPEIKVERAIHDAPSILARLGFTKEKYVDFIRTTFLKRMLNDNVVYHGLAGHFFVQGIGHALKVRIVADLFDRVALEMERTGLSREAAMAILRKDDEERRKWSEHLYGIDTADPQLYDLVINTKQITVEEAANIICHTAGLEQFKTTEESRKALAERLKT